MNKSSHILKLISLVAFCFLTSCLPSEPFSNSKQNLVVEKRIIGSWIGKYYTSKIELINSEDYKIYFEQHSDFIEQSMDFKIEAVGNLYRFENNIIGQFKTTSFKMGAESKSTEYQEMKELKGHYIIGVIESIDNDSFVFNWLPYEAFGDYKSVTTKMMQQKMPELIKSGEYKKGTISFTKLTKDFTAEQYHARERAKIEAERKYCLDIVSGQIPIKSIIDKYFITNDELSCLAGAVGEQKEIDQQTLTQLLELSLPVRGLVSISRHQNSTIETKREALHKILFSDRKNFEGGNPLAEKRDNRNRIIAYHPIVTKQLFLDNANLLESNPEWYNNKKFIDFIFNIVRIGITPPEAIDLIVDKINEVLTMHVDGKESVFMKQGQVQYLLRDIYLHDNILEKTRAKMLNFYKGAVDTELKQRHISLLNGVLINNVCTVYWAKDQDIIDLINFVIAKNIHGAGIGYINGVSYHIGPTYYKNLPNSGIDYSRIINKNILPVETLVELAKQNPSTIRFSLSKINDKKDLSDIKISLDHEIKSIEMEVDSLSKLTELSTVQKNKMYWLGNAIKSHSSLLAQIEQKINAL